MRARHRRRRQWKPAVAAWLGLGLALAAGGVALAAWVVTVTSGSNYAAATAQTLPTGTTPTATVSPVSGQVVTITFAQTSTSGGTPVTAYVVSRFAVGSSSGIPVSGSCAITAGTVTCTDSPGSGSWQYTDTATIASSSWVGTASAKSTAVVVQALTITSVSAAASSVVQVGVTPWAVLAGTTTTPAPGGSISFSVFGPQATAPSSCSGTGWSTVGSAVPVTAAGTYNASSSYTPTAAGTYWWEALYSGDAYNDGSSASCSVNSTVVHLALSPATLPAATVYTAYSQAVTASGGTAPYTYALTSGSLPTGLSLSSSGTLSGTISAAGQAGTFPIVVTATDHAGLTGSSSYTLTVNAPMITLSSLSVTTVLATTAYTQSITASGGTAAYTYAVSAGALPTGLSLSSSGSLSGTLAAVSTSTVYSFTVTATDAHSYTGTNTYSLTVVPMLTGTSLGSGSCSLITLGSCSISSTATIIGHTELVLIYTTGVVSPSVSSVTGPFNSSAGTGKATLVASTSFSSDNDVYAYTATGNGSSGTVSASISVSLLTTTVIDVVQLAGNAPASGVVQSIAGSGPSTPVKSTFSGAPAAFDGEVILAAAPSSSMLMPSPTSTVSASGLLFDVYVLDPAATSESFTMESSGPWGSIGMEFAHN